MRRKQLRAKNGSMSSGSTFQDVFFWSNVFCILRST
jgi:hypothetical protein